MSLAFRTELSSPKRFPSSCQLREEIVHWVSQLRAFLQPGWDCCTAPLQARLIPIDAEGRPRHACPVRLKGIDEHGVAFEHSWPLPDRRAMFSVESPQFGRFVAEIDLGWSRYLEGGSYASGGRIVQITANRR